MAAGGMRRRADHGTLAERAARSRGPELPPPAPPPPASPVPAGPVPPPGLRHCWVVGDSGPLPALILGWERRATGWWGRVVHPVAEGDGGEAGWVVVEAWLPADRLRPVGDGGPPGATPRGRVV